MEGFLLKASTAEHGNKKWKKLYFILHDNVIEEYSTNPSDMVIVKQKKMIQLAKGHVIAVEELVNLLSDKDYVAEKTHQFAFRVIDGQSRLPYYFSAMSRLEMEHWILVLEQTIVKINSQDNERIGILQQSEDMWKELHLMAAVTATEKDKYEITSRVWIRRLGYPEQSIVWTIWRKVSSFKQLDEKLRNIYREAMGDIFFPQYPRWHLPHSSNYSYSLKLSIYLGQVLERSEIIQFELKGLFEDFFDCRVRCQELIQMQASLTTPRIHVRRNDGHHRIISSSARNKQVHPHQHCHESKKHCHHVTPDKLQTSSVDATEQLLDVKSKIDDKRRDRLERFGKKLLWEAFEIEHKVTTRQI